MSPILYRAYRPPIFRTLLLYSCAPLLSIAKIQKFCAFLKQIYWDLTNICLFCVFAANRKRFGVSFQATDPLSQQKNGHKARFFVGWGGRFRTTKCRSFLVADLTARLFSSRYGYPLAMMGADSIRYLPGYQRHACKLNLCRRELTHLRRGDFSTDSTDYGTQMTGRSSR